MPSHMSDNKPGIPIEIAGIEIEEANNDLDSHDCSRDCTFTCCDIELTCACVSACRIDNRAGVRARAIVEIVSDAQTTCQS